MAPGWRSDETAAALASAGSAPASASAATGWTTASAPAGSEVRSLGVSFAAASAGRTIPDNGPGEGSGSTTDFFRAIRIPAWPRKLRPEQGRAFGPITAVQGFVLRISSDRAAERPTPSLYTYVTDEQREWSGHGTPRGADRRHLRRGLRHARRARRHHGAVAGLGEDGSPVSDRVRHLGHRVQDRGGYRGGAFSGGHA